MARGEDIPMRSTAEKAQALRDHFGVERFDEWLVTAQPGAQILYGVGAHAVEAAAPGVAARMRHLSDHGLVHLFAPRRQRADGDFQHPFDFLAVRSSAPVPKGFPNLARSIDQRLRDKAQAARERDWQRAEARQAEFEAQATSRREVAA